MALSAAIACLAFQEFGLRAQGRKAWVGDDKDLWSAQQMKVFGNDSAIALVGTSRMHVGLALDVFRRRFPNRPIAQLAIDGAAPLPTLRDLADDPSFQSVVLCELDARNLLPEDDESAQEDYVRHARKVWSTARRIDRALRTMVQERLVMMSPDLTPRLLFSSLLHQKWPKRSYIRMRADRSIIARYDWLTPAELVNMTDSLYQRTDRLFEQTARPVSDAKWLSRIEGFDSLVARIEKHGGRVVIIRFPSSGALRELEERYYPRRKYWDVLARSTRADAIHFENFRSTAGLLCPEGSHLNRADSVRFTDFLADELVRRGILEPRSEHREH